MSTEAVAQLPLPSVSSGGSKVSQVQSRKESRAPPSECSLLRDTDEFLRHGAAASGGRGAGGGATAGFCAAVFPLAQCVDVRRREAPLRVVCAHMSVRSGVHALLPEGRVAQEKSARPALHRTRAQTQRGPVETIKDESRAKTPCRESQKEGKGSS